MSESAIAVVGLACRFPGDAATPDDFFEMLVQGREAWSKIPKDRFDVDAFHHPSRERPGSLVTKGGYFLKEDVSKWDAAFFATTATEARAIDPQQRILLELTYEGLESAGIPIESIAGTETACFVGGFTHDYKNIIARDFHAAPQYAITGAAQSLLSNRISWFFNLKGASVSCDTACSSSLSALHLACETIRSETNKTRCAVVGGTNLILDPDDPTQLNQLGFLSPDGRCFAFDSRANGYARGEGICVLVLKHIDDAIRDGDPIRAVIRATGLNQDGKTAGIVLPHQDAQMELIKNTYELAGLDPSDTQYVELHGTGTKAGDPTEMGSIARTISKGQRNHPLYCGSVKTQIGHTEGTAGIAGLLKCILALERSVIPPHLNLIKPNPRLQLDKWNIVLPRTATPWPTTEQRRASVNNFGFGGANAHCIVDDAYNYLRLRGIPPERHAVHGGKKHGHAKSGLSTNYTGPSNRLRAIVLSAPEQEAIGRQRKALVDYLKRAEADGTLSTDMISDLAHTLSKRRSIFQWRHAVVAGSPSDLISALDNPSIKPAKALTPNNIAYVFTGQGAQWFAMGRELITFDVFAKSVEDSAALFNKMGAPWNAVQEFLAPEEVSKVNQAEFSQPLCAMLQIALTDLLTHWGVKPQAVVGHSSGEIAAAYAAGALSKEDCLKLGYHRGIVSRRAKEIHQNGGMMAVGLSPEDVQPYLAQFDDDAVVVACVNSPGSVTLSGERTALLDLQQAFNDKKVFNRLLQIETAYHSPQMQSVAREYKQAISDISPLPNTSVQFHSSVLGHLISPTELTAEYWVANLCSPVQFVAALDSVLYADAKKKTTRTKSKAIHSLVEVGPHSALAGPIKQFKTARKDFDAVDYDTMLVRGKDAAVTAMELASRLWSKGVAVDLGKVNNATRSPLTNSKVMVDLPSYPWNHSTSYWHESRRSKNHRQPPAPRNDIIGSRIDDNNPSEPTWRNYLRLGELPWLRDHKIHGDVVMPAAGMICMAIEAARQIAASEDSAQTIKSFELRDVCINRPLVIPEEDTGIETLLHLKRRKLGMGTGAGNWYEFSLYSCQDGNSFAEHACGLIEIHHSRDATEVDGGLEQKQESCAHKDKFNTLNSFCNEPVATPSHYSYWDSQGLSFGPLFRGLTSMSKRDCSVVFQATIPDSRARMPANHETELLVHPATLDALLQVMLVAIPRQEDVPKQVWIPSKIREIKISNDVARKAGEVLHGTCESTRSGFREMVGTIITGDGVFDKNTGITMEGVTFTGLGSTQGLSQSTEQSEKARLKLCSKPSWKPDLDLIAVENHQQIFAAGVEVPDDLVEFCNQSHKVIEILCRRAGHKIESIAPADLPSYLTQFLQWMKKRGYSTSPLSKSEEDKLLDNFSVNYPFDGKFCMHVFNSLEDIFTQKTTGIATLMAEDNLNRFYRETYACDLSVHAFENWFELMGHKNPGMKVIEIGGGTASMTLPVLKQLGGNSEETPRFSEWMFTDISAGFFDNAKSLLKDWGSRVDFKRLDIEQDPTTQGFEPGTYDVVLAVNVLHATKSLKRTLEHCRSLLKPGGKILLGENTNPMDLSSWIFGPIPGWWVSEDGREDGPLISEGEWDKELRKAGFTGTDIVIRDNDHEVAHRMSMLVSTRKDEKIVPSKDIIVLTPDSCTNFTSKVATLLQSDFQRTGHKVEIQDLSAGSSAAAGKTFISLLEYESSFFENIQATQFEQIKEVLLQSAEVLWVTRSDLADGPGHPTKRIVSGLLRCLKTEDSTRRVYELHFTRDLNSGLESAAQAVYNRLHSIWDVKEKGREEMETVEQNGVFQIPRYTPEKVLNRSLALKELGAVPETANLLQHKRDLKLTIGTPGMLDTLHFIDDDVPLQPLGDDEVEIDTKACAINFLDIMIAMGQVQHPILGYEAGGLIKRVGAKVTKFKKGDKVLYMGLGAMRTTIRADQISVHLLPSTLTLEEGVTIPIAYATAYQSLIEVARIRKGESILVHAAAGGLGQALIQIAKMIGAEIFATVGNNAKKQAVIDLGVKPDHIFSSRDMSFAQGIKRITAGKGVDVVVNSLAGEGLRKSWECLAPYGRFIEVGKKDILGNSGLDMRPFLENTLFAGVNLEKMMSRDPVRGAELVDKVLQLFENRQVDLVKPITTADFTDMESTFRQMQRGTHIGKLVLRVTPNSRVPVIPRLSVPCSLDADATYLLVGGLGGLGRGQALLLAEHGAKNIVFISRSGDKKPEAKELIQRLRGMGVNAHSYAGDVADRAQMQEIVAHLSSTMPPVRGVMQGAMVLNDGLFHKMTYEQWQNATRPKIQGTWNLHELLPKDLDFFIVLSSLAGIIGSISQSNYSAGNTYQDALMHYRKAKGHSGQSLDLGLMRGIGYIEEHEDAAAHTSSLKFTSVQADQFFHILRAAMMGTMDGETPVPTQLLLGAGSGGSMLASRAAGIDGDYYWLRTLSHFAYMQLMDVQTATNGDDHAGNNGLIGQLASSTSMDQATELVQQILLEKISKSIMTPASDIDASKPVYSYGVDSLVAVELRNWLELELQSDISIFDLTSSAPITDVCKKIASRSQIVATALKDSEVA
ncbi:polyketide synthase [Xylariales sp. PMI_506]|nr:polyketide synthase [Xylariales sp. PMI_506]